MSNDKTILADVQPGGMVRLGDQAERARFEAWVKSHVSSLARAADGDYASNFTLALWSAWQAALSAQPSPGGQDALAALQQDYDKLLDSFNRQVEVAEKIAGRVLQQDDRIEELEEALAARQPVELIAHKVGDYRVTVAEDAITVSHGRDIVLAYSAGDPEPINARQPVGATDQQYNSGGIELTACQLHEALLMAGSPELDVPFEDRSVVRIFWTETGHSGRGLYCECVGAEEDGCILLDGTAPAIGRPAQAVDLKGARDSIQALLNWIDDWAETPEESGLDPIADRALEVVAQIDAQVYAHEPNTNSAQAVDLGTGVKAIAAERERQLCAEGFTRDSDRQYQRGELAKAATAYVQLAAMDLAAGGTRDHIAWHGPAPVWPWAPEWWKPVDARHDLVRAGALIAAQIDLIDSQAVGNG